MIREMRWMLLVLWMLIAMANTAGAADWPDSMFEANSYDLGSVAQGRYRLNLRLSNPLDVQVRIDRIDRMFSFCRCELPAETTIEPGESIELPVWIDATRLTGSWSDWICVWFDSPERAGTRVAFRWNARQDLMLTPGWFDLSAQAGDSAPSASLRVRYAGDKQWRIESVESTSTDLQTCFQEIRREPDRGGFSYVEYEITVTAKSDAELDLAAAEVLIGINDGRTSILHVPVWSDD